MTIEEAIYQLKTLIEDREDFIRDNDPENIFLLDKQACEMGIQALEKQVPKKVLNFMLNDGNEKLIKVFKGICPYCQCIVNNEYCSRCGQALDWSDSDA